MAASYKARCVVLKKTKLGETDLILTLMDAQGRQIRAVAKGARKPGNKRFGARLEPFGVCDLVLYPGRSLDTITDARCVAPHARVRESLARTSACSIIAELLDKVTADGELDETSFACVTAVLDAIDAAEEDRACMLACACVLKIVAMMGIRPILAGCALCGGELEDGAAFSIEAGGMLCASCAADGHSHPVEGALVRWVSLLMTSRFAALMEVAKSPDAELLVFVDAWVREHLGIRLKTIDFAKVSL